jgi:hypothetical protein
VSIVDLSVIEWGTPPPPPKKKTSRGGSKLSPGQVVVAAAMRPNVWGSLDGWVGNAGAFASQLRRLGIEAVSREGRVYFRAVD